MASDVAKSLGYINAKDAVKRHVDDDEIAGIENKVNDLTDSFEDLKKLIVERLK